MFVSIGSKKHVPNRKCAPNRMVYTQTQTTESRYNNTHVAVSTNLFSNLPTTLRPCYMLSQLEVCYCMRPIQLRGNTRIVSLSTTQLNEDNYVIFYYQAVLHAHTHCYTYFIRTVLSPFGEMHRNISLVKCCISVVS